VTTAPIAAHGRIVVEHERRAEAQGPRAALSIEQHDAPIADGDL
jgi:hypothetical protein